MPNEDLQTLSSDFLLNNTKLAYEAWNSSPWKNSIPENIFLDSVLINSFLVNGENLLAIQIHNVGPNSSDMSSNFFLTFGISDESEFYSQPPIWFQEPVAYDESNLPLILSVRDLPIIRLILPPA